MQFKIKLRALFLSIFLIQFNLLPSYNSYGQIGYINTPSAFNSKESEIGFILDRGEPDRKIILHASPFSWLDANIFYLDIGGLPYGSGYKQSRKDKGFSFKVSLPLNDDYIFAIGANDIAGTGYLNSEYMVVSSKRDRLEYSLGLGWGVLSGGYNFKNPFINIDNSFRNRSTSVKDYGGSVDLNNLFSGSKTALFFGLSYEIDNKRKIILESDPTNLSLSQIPYSSRKTKFNLGYQQKLNNFKFKTSLIGGEELSFQIAYSSNFLKYNSVDYVSARSQVKTYDELQRILALNQIGLKTVEESEDSLIVRVVQNAFHNQYDVNQVVRTASKNIEKRQYAINDVVVWKASDKKNITIVQEFLDMEMIVSSFPANKPSNIREENYKDFNSKKVLYKAKRKFPIVANQLTPTIKPFIASREKFLHAGLLLENNTEVIFQENFLLKSNLKYSIADNFDDLYIGPQYTYPNQVRSDVKDYLNNFGNGIIIGRLELNYFKEYNRKHFFRYTFGLFEDMFGGLGVDYVFHPEGSLYSFGAEYYVVKKRDYKMRFGFLDYKNDLFRISSQIIEPKTKIYTNISYGEYLAGDIGYTLEIGRRFNNGVQFAGFFTRTDVPKELFGEGSFDKGIKLKIPLNLFNRKKRSLSNFTWRPLTKDPGALVVKSIEMHDQVQRFRIY